MRTRLVALHANLTVTNRHHIGSEATCFDLVGGDYQQSGCRVDWRRIALGESCVYRR